MFAYIVLLLVTAFVAYLSGSISTRRLAGLFVFHRDLTGSAEGMCGCPTSVVSSESRALSSSRW